MNIQVLKEKFLNCMDQWLEGRVDEMLSVNPTMLIPSVYIKRGCHNIIKKYQGKISESIDKVSLFLADEEGNVDAESLFTDAMTLFREMEETSFDLGILRGTLGKGKISFALPDNVLMNILFSNKKTLTFNENDFMELKSLLQTDVSM